MRIVVTGGYGFLGRNFIDTVLAQTDWDIINLDWYTYASENNLKKYGKIESSRVQTLWKDLSKGYPRLLAYEKIDFLVNFASFSHVDKSIEDPVDFISNNVMLSTNVLELAREAKPKKVVMVSTDEVYGPAPQDVAFREWDSHLPSNPYAASKSAQESLAIAWWRTYGVPVVITNTTNNYGPYQHEEKFIPKAVALLSEGRLVPVHAHYGFSSLTNDCSWQSGSRCWIHARDHSEAILHILNNISLASYPTSDRPSKFNVVGRDEVVNDELAKKLAGIMRVEAKLDYVDAHSTRPGHDLRYALSGKKLASLGWQPKITLSEGLKEVVDHYSGRTVQL